MNITKEFILSVSANNATVKNGADLVKKKSYTKLVIDKDQTFIGGECLGSGKNPYICSGDFINENEPVFRCTCPSRQIPCKHVIGLLWAFAEGHTFSTEEVPEDIIAKRETKEKRITKAKEKIENSTPKEKSAAWKKSAVKKIDAQLAGIAEAEKLLNSIVQTGLGAMDAKNIKIYLSVVKQLDSYFITGIQNEFNDLLGMVNYYSGGDTKDQTGYANIVEKLCQIHTLIIKSKAYLENKKEAPDKMETESEIEELIGYAWKLEELAQYGLFETDASLVELCFHVRREDDKKQFVDEGFYIGLNSGKIYKTRNYRPFKALKHIKEDDSVFSVLNIPKLYVYPSQSLNPRVRWDAYTLSSFEEMKHEICKSIKSHAQLNFAEVIKTVKNQLKNSLLSSNPVILVKFSKISKIIRNVDNTEGSGYETYVIYDESGNTICLRRNDYCQEGFTFLLDRLTQEEAQNNVMPLLFYNDIETGTLSAQPLALVTDEKIIRLVY